MNRQYYMIGITGIGMSSLAQIIRRQGFSVRGSDANPDNKIAGILNSLGIDVFPGHQTGRIDKEDTVIYSTAVSKSNPEYIDAERNRCRIVHRSCALKNALDGKKLIAVTGTHGKTTTAYIVSTVLKNAGFDFGMILGGISKNSDNNFFPGEIGYVAELDESDRSFQLFDPEIKIITSLSRDHLEFYGNDFLNLKQEFICFLQKKGVNIISGDDDNLLKAARESSADYITFGIDRDADYKGEIIEKGACFSKIRVFKKGNYLADYKLPLLGYKNALNSLAVFAVFDVLGYKISNLAEYFSGLLGVERRYDFKHKSDSISFIEDYAHHPEEISEVINTVKDYLSPKRVIVAFQPHRYSRTKHLWSDFKWCFQKADIVLIVDIYSAFEDAIYDISSKKLVGDMGSEKISYVPISDLADKLLSVACHGDVVLLLGAGDINSISNDIKKGLEHAG